MTERMTLRPMTIADFESMRELDSDPEAVQFLGRTGLIPWELEDRLT